MIGGIGMEGNERREEILNLLKEKKGPIKGMNLAEIFHVSRQVIVQDIALLRAKGEDILSTPQGYLILDDIKEDNLKKTIVCKHSGYDEIEDELKTIIDLGGKAIDVIIEHPVYGEIRSPLMISSRLELDEFMRNIKKTNAEPLSSLTDGVHIHTIEVEDEYIFQKIVDELKKKKYLISYE